MRDAQRLLPDDGLVGAAQRDFASACRRSLASVAIVALAVIAAEPRCCAFLDMKLRREPEGLVLDITGPEGTGPIIAELFA